LSGAACATACLGSAMSRQINTALMAKTLDIFEVLKGKINS
jgi:hypothetical protein